MSDIVLTRDRSSGRIHRRVRVGKNLASFEACNMDTAGEYDILFEVPSDAGAKLCRRCFAEPVSPVRRDPSDPTDEGPVAPV